MRNPATQVAEKMVYKSESLIELTVGISEELMHKIQRVQDLLASKNRESATISDSLEYVINQALERLDPIEKAKRALKRASGRKTKSTSSNHGPIYSSGSGHTPSAKKSSSVENSLKLGSSQLSAEILGTNESSTEVSNLSAIYNPAGDGINSAEESAEVGNSCAPQQSCVPGRADDLEYGQLMNIVEFR
jgi:hypothetical protein